MYVLVNFVFILDYLWRSIISSSVLKTAKVLPSPEPGNGELYYLGLELRTWIQCHLASPDILRRPEF